MNATNRNTMTIAETNAANAAVRAKAMHYGNAFGVPQLAKQNPLPKKFAALTARQLFAMLDLAQGIRVPANASNAALLAALTKRHIAKRGARKAYKLTPRGTALLAHACYALTGAKGLRVTAARLLARKRLAHKRATGLRLYVAA